MSNYNENFMDTMSIAAFAISLLNYNENLQQSKNDDIMKEVDDTTNVLIDKLESEFGCQNKLLASIDSKLDRLLAMKEDSKAVTE